MWMGGYEDPSPTQASITCNWALSIEHWAQTAQKIQVIFPRQKTLSL